MTTFATAEFTTDLGTTATIEFDIVSQPNGQSTVEVYVQHAQNQQGRLYIGTMYHKEAVKNRLYDAPMLVDSASIAFGNALNWWKNIAQNLINLFEFSVAANITQYGANNIGYRASNIGFWAEMVHVPSFIYFLPPTFVQYFGDLLIEQENKA